MEQVMERWKAPAEVELHESLFSIQQTGSVADYRARFELISGRIFNLNDETLAGTFMCGFKPDIREVVRVAQSQGFVSLMGLVQMMENKAAADKPVRGGFRGG